MVCVSDLFPCVCVDLSLSTQNRPEVKRETSSCVSVKVRIHYPKNLVGEMVFAFTLCCTMIRILQSTCGSQTDAFCRRTEIAFAF